MLGSARAVAAAAANMQKPAINLKVLIKFSQLPAANKAIQ
jgi:hypothetical protein